MGVVEQLIPSIGWIGSKKNLKNWNIVKMNKQAGAVLGQAQIKLEVVYEVLDKL